MIDHLDTQTNDFLENDTRGDVIRERQSYDIWNDSVADSRRHIAAAKSARTANLPLFDTITTPADSIFHGNPLAAAEPIYRPPTEKPKKSHKGDKYARKNIDPGGFISYKAIEDFCSKVGEM